MKLNIFHQLLNRFAISNLINRVKTFFNKRGKEIKPIEPFHREAHIAALKREHRNISIQTARKNRRGLPLGVSRQQAAKARYYRKHKDELAKLPTYIRQQIETTIARMKECHVARQRMRQAKVAA